MGRWWWAACRRRRIKRLFTFWILGCTRDLPASSLPLYRPVALLRASKSAANPRDISSRSPSDPKREQPLRGGGASFPPILRLINRPSLPLAIP